MSAYHAILPLSLVAVSFMSGGFSEAHLGSKTDKVFVKNGLPMKETAFLDCPGMVQCHDEGGAAKLHGAIDPIQSVRLSTDKNLDCCCGRCAKGAFCHTCAGSHCGWCCTDGTCASCTTSYCGFCTKGCCSPDEKGFGNSCTKASIQPCPYGSCTSCYKDARMVTFPSKLQASPIL